MREIKFKAFHKSDKKMYEVTGFSLGKWFLRGKNFPMPRSAIEVMQYTGLKDKNGVEIYEGYIVKVVDEPWGNEVIDQIRIVNGCAMYGKHLAHLVFEGNQFVNVIGNIYVNPELLTARKQ